MLRPVGALRPITAPPCHPAPGHPLPHGIRWIWKRTVCCVGKTISMRARLILQSSTQGIQRQTSLGGGVGRFLKKQSCPLYRSGWPWMAENRLCARRSNSGVTKYPCGVDYIKSAGFQLQEDYSRCYLHPGAGAEPARPSLFQSKRFLLPQSIWENRLEFFVLWKLGYSTTGTSSEQQLRHDHRAELDVWKQVIHMLREPKDIIWLGQPVL